MAFHPLGTARADADPARGVLDPDLRVHGVDGLYVADGSVMPSSLGVNPQITIMALATRLADHLLGCPLSRRPIEPDVLDPDVPDPDPDPDVRSRPPGSLAPARRITQLSPD